MGRVVVGMLGLGTVGQGVVRLLSQQKHLVLKKVAVKDLTRKRDFTPPCPVVANPSEVIDDPEIEVLVEVIGGEKPALDYLMAAIDKRKHIVTANKEVLAKHGPELFARARAKGVTIFFEASVAGGVPLISTLYKGLEANEITRVQGILNGTTNFILSAMEEQGQTFAEALAKAQELGFAEADPTSDVEGYDVAYKLSVVSALAFGRFVKPDSIYRQGITAISKEDINQARELGYRIKLVGSTRKSGNSLDVRVTPALVPLSHPLAAVSGGNNGILVHGDAVGNLTMVGPGAGQMPTASAVVGDIMNLSSALQLPDFATYFQGQIESTWAASGPPGDFTCPFYLKLEVKDHPGVIGHIGTIFGACNISIQSIIQRGTTEGGATVIILTHSTRQGDMENALAELTKRDFLQRVASALRIFEQ